MTDFSMHHDLDVVQDAIAEGKCRHCSRETKPLCFECARCERCGCSPNCVTREPDPEPDTGQTPPTGGETEDLA